MKTNSLHGWNHGLLVVSALSLFLASTPAAPAVKLQERAATPTPELHRGPRDAHRVALTFDAGGEAGSFPALLGVLAEARVRCTFFLTGKWMRDHPDLIQVLVSSGHELGNHTWSHRDLTQLDDAQIRLELLQTGSLLAKHLPGKVCRWWRAPFGERDRRVLRIASELGYVSVYWTLDSLDSVAPPKSSAFLVKRINQRSNAELEGAIILMHVGEPATVEALPAILRSFQRRGLEVVTVSGLLDFSAYRFGTSKR